LLIGFDVASYSSDGVTVADLQFQDTIERAETAGYTVERVGSSGFRSEDAVEDAVSRAEQTLDKLSGCLW